MMIHMSALFVMLL